MKISDDFVAGSSRQARPSSHVPPGSDFESGPGENESGSRGGLIQSLLRFVEDTFGAAEGLVEVYADRMRASVRKTIVQAALGAGAAVCAVVWLGAATLAILRGICGGCTALWGGRVWLGDLTGGVLACALAGGAIALYLRLSSRRELERLKRKYERIRNGHSQDHHSVSPADHG